jgi:hypothetical protein
VKGEKRTTLAILMLAVASLILASVFEPRIGVEAKARQESQYILEDVSSWLLRLAALTPVDAPAEQPACRHGAPQARASLELL